MYISWFDNKFLDLGSDRVLKFNPQTPKIDKVLIFLNRITSAKSLAKRFSKCTLYLYRAERDLDKWLSVAILRMVSKTV